MKRIAQVVSGIALAGTLLPAVLFFLGRLDLPSVKHWMMAATLAWFIATPLSRRRQPKQG